MQALIWVGVVLTLLGLAGLIWCILVAMRAKREGLEGDALKARMQKVVAVNMGALGLSTIGLMCVIMGIALA